MNELVATTQRNAAMVEQFVDAVISMNMLQSYRQTHGHVVSIDDDIDI